MLWLQALSLIVIVALLSHIVCTAIINRIDQRANRNGRRQ